MEMTSTDASKMLFICRKLNVWHALTNVTLGVSVEGASSLCPAGSHMSEREKEGEREGEGGKDRERERERERQGGREGGREGRMEREREREGGR